MSRQAPLHAGSGARGGGSDSGGFSVRKAVVVRPARTSGCATSQRRNGRFVVTPPTSVSRSAAREPVVRLGARRPVRDQLRDHRVVRRADLVALLDARVDAHARRQAQPLDRPGLRQERPRVLGVQPHLDRVTEQRRCPSTALAARDAQLLAHEVDSRNELRHRMLDLDARVQLEEEEVAAVEHELRGARALVADCARERDRRIAHAARAARGRARVDGDSSSTF